MADEQPKKVSLTADDWKQIQEKAAVFEAEWMTGNVAIPLSELLPIWNAAMKKVHADGAALGRIDMCETLKQQMIQGKKIEL